MKNKTIKIMGIAIILLFLTGCTGFGKKDTPIADTNVYQGTGSLEVEFLKDSPPDKIYETERFQVSALLKNKGAFPINNGTVVLTYEPDYIDVTDKKTSSDFSLKGKDIYTPSDDNVLKTFFLSSYNIDPKSFEHQSVVLLTACYDYGTKLNTEICVDTDPQNIKLIEKPCQVEDLSFSGQGSPISITKVETRMLVTEGQRIKPQFLIHIKNEGDGQIISSDKDVIKKSCGSNSINKTELNGVILKNLSFSEYNIDSMDCKPKADEDSQATLRLVNGEGYFICTLKDEKAISQLQKSTFKSNLYVELEYGYTITKSKEFTIQKFNT